MSSPNKTIKLPRLRTRDELLKTSPELFNKLLLGEDMSSARSTGPAVTQPTKTMRAVQSAGGQAALMRTASRSGMLGQTYDTPRGFGDEPLTIDQELAIELGSVKRERVQLMDSIAQVKAEAGTAGGEAQQADIRQLLKELELKKAKLNELKGESRKAEAAVAKIRDDDTDAQRLTPDDCVEENNYIQGLRDEMTQVEEDLQEADAKNRLYQLLGERTRREHMAIDQKVRDKQDCLRACMEDLANLTEHFNTTRAAKELAQKELAKIKRQVEEARHDWTRKIRERRGEVNELQKRQRKEHEKEVKRREKQQEKEKAERAAQAKLRMEEEAYQLQVAALAPKIEAMEASWNRLRAISGAETPEQVIDYWQGLQAKESRMRELVALAERREASCKADISNLLTSRSTMYEAANKGSSMQTLAVGAGAASSKALAAEGVGQDAAATDEGNQELSEDDGEDDETVAASHAKIAEADKRMESAQGQFNKLRGICVAAEQGMRSLAQRLSIALEAPAAVALSTPPAPHDPVPGQSSNLPGSRLTSAGGLSTASGGHEGLRRSAGGSSTSGHPRATRDHAAVTVGGQQAPDGHMQQPASMLASKAQRLSSNARGRASSSHAEGAGSGATLGGLALVPEDSTGSRKQRGSMDNGPQIAGLSLPGAGHTAGSRAVLPSRGRNTIDDDSFFEGLPQLLTEVTEKLEKLMAAGQSLDFSVIAAAAVEAGMLGSGASGYSSAASTARMRGSGGSTAEPTPRGAVIKSVAAGLLPAAGAASSSGSVKGATAAAAPSEGRATGEDVAVSRASEAVSASGASSHEAAESSTAQGADAPAGSDEETAAAAEAGEESESASRDPIHDTESAAAGDADAAADAMEAAESDSQQQGVPADGSQPVADAANSVQTAPAAEPTTTLAAAPALAAAAAADANVQQPVAAADSAAAGGSPSNPIKGSTVVANSPGGASTFLATQSPIFAGSLGRQSMASSIMSSEKALMKGMHRRTWVGAPWLDAVSDNPLDVKLVPSMKRKKGKKKEATGPDLSRILGYIPPNDVPAESESDSDDNDAADAGAGPGADGVVDREWIKMRAAKITARHNAKAAAAAAAQSQGR